MAKLEAMLEQRGIATPREMSEAIARCQLHGGDLTTSLLQFVNADEALLSAALSECYGLTAATVGLLPSPDDAALRSLPRDVAERYCCFPLEAGPGRLVLAVAHPLETALHDELGLTLGVVIEQRVALEVRIRQALSRFYGLPLSARNQRGISRLDGDVEAVGHETPLGLWSDTQLSNLPRTPSDLPPGQRDSQRPPSVRPRTRSETPRFGSGAPPPSSATRGTSRRRGPLSLARAREELGRAPSRNEVLDIFFNFASQYFEYSALFAVHNSLAEGLDAWGKGADRDTVLGIGVPLDLPSSLSEAAESCKVRLTRLGKEGIDRTLMADLQRQFNGKALVLPVSLRGRCAVLLYADNGEADVVEREVADVIAIAGDVANALGRIILQRKKQKAPEHAELTGSNGERRSLPPQGGPSSVPARRSNVIDAPDPLPSDNRDRSRNNARRGSRPDASLAPLSNDPPSVQTQPVVAIGPNDSHATRSRPSSSPSASPAAASSSPAPGAAGPRSEPSSGEDPVFLLARPHGRGSAHAVPPEPRSPFASTVQKPPISITLPAPIIGNRPRLPSVIVDPESADPDESERLTRAAAITRAPSQARSTASVRRPAVPPPAEAPRTVSPPHYEKLAAAPAPGGSLSTQASLDALEDEAMLGEDLGEAIDAADPTLSAEEALGATAWPPPIMDNSPPPRQPPLTALVPIIIADSPKGKRGYITARGSNVGRAAGKPALTPSGARPSSNPPARSPASPTVPSPARTRRLDPAAAALAPGATRTAGDAGEAALRSAAGANPATEIIPTLGEAVLAAAMAGPHPGAGAPGNGTPSTRHATALARAAARSSSASHAPFEPDAMRTIPVRGAEPRPLQSSPARGTAPLVTPRVDIDASPAATEPSGTDHSPSAPAEAAASALLPSRPLPRPSAPSPFGASLASLTKTSAPPATRARTAAALETRAEAPPGPERTSTVASPASPGSLTAAGPVSENLVRKDLTAKDPTTKDLVASAMRVNPEVEAVPAATSHDAEPLPTAARASAPAPSSPSDAEGAPDSGLSDPLAWPDVAGPSGSARAAEPALASDAAPSTASLEAATIEAASRAPAIPVTPAPFASAKGAASIPAAADRDAALDTITRSPVNREAPSRDAANSEAPSRDAANPEAANPEAPSRDAANPEAPSRAAANPEAPSRDVTTLEAATLDAVTRVPASLGPPAIVEPLARVSTSPTTVPAPSSGSADIERAPDSGLSDPLSWPDPESSRGAPFASQPAPGSTQNGGSSLAAPSAAPSTRPAPSAPNASGSPSAAPRSPYASGSPLALPSATPSTRLAPSSTKANGSPSVAPSGSSSTPPSVPSPLAAGAAGVRPAMFPPPPSDADTDIEELVDRACQGNLKAVQDLARIGATSLPQVMARFPGPVISERAGPTSRASECGPLLQALAAIGSAAMPSITQSSQNEDARVRRWATLLLGEMPGPEACRAVVQRLADDVPRVHQAALDAARLLLAGPAADLFRKTLFEVAEAEDAPLTLRLRTLEHVAKLKDSASVPRLIAFLGADMEPIVHKALWALTVVTRHDFGRDSRAWSDFWHSQQSRHRLEWLIDALDDRDPRLRKAAADELREETSDLFGYAENLSRPERLEAQAKFRAWWETSGAARHGRGV